VHVSHSMCTQIYIHVYSYGFRSQKRWRVLNGFLWERNSIKTASVEKIKRQNLLPLLEQISSSVALLEAGKPTFSDS